MAFYFAQIFIGLKDDFWIEMDAVNGIRIMLVNVVVVETEKQKMI